MTIGVVGIGLIGGSLAKALKKNTKHTVLGYDNHSVTLQYAQLTDMIDGILTPQAAATCDYLFLATYPQATVDYVTEVAPYLSAQNVVIDCGGVKAKVCDACWKLAKQYGFTFIGGHPMAGLHRSGIKYATADLYQNASMILTPQDTKDIALLERATSLIKSMGFGSVAVTTPEQHDRIIAFTSQLAHVVSNAYVKSPTAAVHKGFSAGSYQDLTRVARLNEVMWTQLFLANRDNLKAEIDILIQSLQEYREALEQNDSKRLQALLKDGSERKERIDC